MIMLPFFETSNDMLAVSARVGFTADLAAVTVLLTRLTLQGVTWEYAGNSSAIDPKRETPERRDTGY